MTAPDLSVIVVTHNGRDMALATLQSALASKGKADVEWLVVDAGSTDGTPDAIERHFGEVRVLRCDNRGFAASNNVALAEARGRYVLLLNPDIAIQSGTFGDLVEAMDNRPEIGLASIVLRDPDGSLQPSIRRFPSPLRSLGEALFAAHWPVLRGFQQADTRSSQYEVAGEAEWVIGAFLIARREAVQEVGELDERFFLYSEEIDWCYRFWQSGWPVAHLPVMVAIHHSGDRKRGDLMPQLSHSRLLFAEKHYGVWRRSGIRAALALGHTMRIAIFAAMSTVRRTRWHRVEAEWASLRVVLGVSHPPFGPARRNDGESVSSRQADRHFLEERYRGSRRRSLPMRLYYGVKPVVPRRLQIALRRLYARRQMGTQFPRWPIEPLLVERRRAALREELERQDAERLPTLANWPDGKRYAAILTHDVEGSAGVKNVRRIIEIERRRGFVSSWNFVAEWYPIEDGLFDDIRAAGCEIGLHGVKHDCRLFESRARFEAELPAIHRYLDEWGAVGFRSPATHRNPDWMPELGALYDSSFPDTDPFEPQGGGCCSILPYFLGDMVELPITLIQDHTLWEILREDTIDLWTRKSDWIIANEGLINLITHPDYLDTPRRLRMYEEFLEYLAVQDGGWHALPRDIASWWRTRAGLRCLGTDDGVLIEGRGAERASVNWARRDQGDVVFEPEFERI